MLKSLTTIAATLAVSTALFAGAASAQEAKTIGLAVANLQADFFNQIKQSVEKEAQAKGIEVITVDAGGDSATQVSQIQDLITRDVDAIIYIPAGATAASVPVQAAKAANIPVVAVDRNPPDAPADTFIATDSVAAAEELGNFVCKTTGGKGRLAEIQGQIGTTPQIDRDEGFAKAMANCPGIEEVAKQASNQWAQDEGFNIAQAMIQRDPEITIFWGQADALALGAAQAAKVGNLTDVVVVGFDGDVAGLEAVQSGTLTATMTQQTQLMGRLALDSAIKLASGESVPAMQLQPATLTTKENVEPFLTEHP
ncbi:substrate-binding domain-containing protein [Antarcticirhabdus aurantiaca]|uniref:Substrate-binding domain-containing protein n=1 Tax=Antarcticirhabdus aurantiaca TaxID=2606717 RepID=A0ACD4NMY9_9HYPH|nr:substrate-binding domain-containing protein [Antarcticirhabdus aurantiaca]WAJ28103.1 substrate-binding domain-containing protein [Jeongeuplla avenae]